MSVFLSLIGIYQRNKVESHNKSVCIAAEYEVVSSLAAAQGVPVNQAINILKSQGLRGMVLTEEYVSDLVSQGRLHLDSFTTTAGLNQFGTPGSIGALRIFGNPADLARVQKAVAIRFKNANVTSTASGLVITGISPSIIRTLSLGINPEQANLSKAAGLQIIARLNNPVGIDSNGVALEIVWCHDLGATVFLPQGDQVFGRRDAVKTLVETLRANQMLYADPEFAKIGGNEVAVSMAPDLVVRLHSAQVAELDKDTIPAAVERYVKAARERNMRILLLRQTNEAGPQVLRAFGTFVNKVAKNISKEGDRLGPAHAFSEPTTPRVLYCLIGIVQVPIIFWLCTLFAPALALPLAAITLLAAAAAFSKGERNFIAFICALIYPTLAMLQMDGYPEGHVVWKYVRTCLIALAGGLAIAALLSQLRYYVAAQEFQGVKAAVFLPILFGVGYFLKRLAKAHEHLRDPITYFALIVGLIILVALAIMWMRTGNNNPAAVSPMELKFRNLLDRYLFVRPRTKSFLIGLPGLWIAIKMLDRWRKKEGEAQVHFGAWTALALMVALISLTDIVNTFCHIHTPVLLSLERVSVELVIGGVLGAIFWAIGEALYKLASKPEPVPQAE